MLHNHWVLASGYLSIFLMPVLFLVGALQGRTWLAFGTVALVFPLLRMVFGALPAAGPPQWQERVATALHLLPVAYVPILAGCVVAGLTTAALSPAAGGLAWLGLGLSLWMTLLFATCVAHELIHRRDPPEAMLGHLLAGFCGYPLLGMEHLLHHGRAGDTARAEVPLLSEGMWHFAARRLRRIGAELLSRHSPIWRARGNSPGATRVRAAMLAAATTATAFGLIGGWPGFAIYACMVVGVPFGIQLITYIQHWALGYDDIGDKVAFGRGWEEDCRFQAWVTLSISLHDRHHQDSRAPYYRLALSPDSPRLPTGYVLLMFASMVPAFWRALMVPAHERWLKAPGQPVSAGRRLTCFGLGKQAPAVDERAD